MHFPAIYSMQNFNTFWSLGIIMLGIQVKPKLVKFYRNFLRYIFEKLIQTLVYLHTY